MGIIRRLGVHSFRSFHQVELAPGTGLNLFFGGNGVGKTSLLEAIALAAQGRSFRSEKFRTYIQQGQDQTSAFIEVSQSEDHASMTRLGMARFRDGRLLGKVNGQRIESLAQLAEHLPLQIMLSTDASLIEGSRKERQQFIDWALFHVKPSFLSLWRAYHRGLKQRNACLREQAQAPTKYTLDLLQSWTQQLLPIAEQINQLRSEYIQLLSPFFLEVLQQLSPGIEAVIEFRPGWSQQASLEEIWLQQIETDLKRGYTNAGPHRAEWLCRAQQGGAVAADFYSRGQIKLIVCALKIAQGRLMQQQASRKPVYLIDDLPAELDQEHRALFIHQLLQLEAQVFMTCVDIDSFSLGHNLAVSMFHVKHGSVKPVSCTTHGVNIND